MHRIDGPGATEDNRFSEGSPTLGIPPTMVTADWANAVQEEVTTVIAEAGIALDKEDNGQLRDAINALIAAAVAAVIVDPVASTRDMLAGGIIEWEAAVIPTLTDGLPLGLELDGAIVSLTTYPRLLRKWAGAGTNGTVPAWYRCTVGGTRDAAGGYIKLQDRRGEYSRGWDHGRGVDTGRVLGSSQGSTSMSNGTLYVGGTPGAGIIQSISGMENTASVSQSTANSSAATASTSITTGDVRVRNVSTMYIVLV
ncbi:phage tail protein [Desulfovibrio oxamicus]|uniref:Phage tail protein n=1 Tax=Nitratidesulfovibrio oxamicus TaxID=32016 RepID=A0ABS0J468_9BACT|nr:phage tail protein [Nitratidesulfovibrio oxamicus]MBG3877239.1 phage tail protein [Nitratidesulfovibrio oxamicus]